MRYMNSFVAKGNVIALCAKNVLLRVRMTRERAKVGYTMGVYSDFADEQC
jgi:hypothetical protein